MSNGVDLWERLKDRIRRYRSAFPTKYRKGLLKLIVFCTGELLCRCCPTPSVRVKGERLKIVLLLECGLGDHLVCLPYIRKIALKTENTADVFVETSLSQEQSDALFGSDQNFFPKNVFFPRKGQKTNSKSADLVIYFPNHCPVIQRIDGARVLEKDEWLAGYCKKLQEFWKMCSDSLNALLIGHLLDRNIYELKEVPAEIPVESMEFKLNCRISEKEIREKINCRGGGPYITTQRAIGIGTSRRTATRLWSVKSYGCFVKKFKELFPQVKVVQVGAANTAQIAGIDVDIRGKTSFEELKALLKFAVFHLDGESGMVHLNHFLGGRSVVLFGPTSVNIRGYPENVNIKNCPCGADFCEQVLCRDLELRYCVFSRSEEATCMENITPDMVLEACVKNFGQELSQNV